MKKRIEYLIAISSSLILLEIGFFYALVWYWSGFELIGAIPHKKLSIKNL